MGHKPYNEMTASELFKAFEDSIWYDCHSTSIAVGRSEPGMEIIKKGVACFKNLCEHFRQFPKFNEGQESGDRITEAWAILLSWICKDQNLTGQPKLIKDFSGWIKWVEQTAVSYPV